MYQLPVIYEVQDLCGRLFLLFLLVVSILLLKSWEVVPGLILPHIDSHRLYIKKIVYVLGLLVPLILMLNSLLGLLGFVNLVLTMSWYESLFLLVLVGYLIVRGLIIDGMVWISNVVIRHAVNGWLWTEALLKPIDKILRIICFFAAWVGLFMLYGWDKQPIMAKLRAMLDYHLLSLLNTTITPLNICKLVIIISLLFWAARWTREFAYRFLATRIQDSGLRNSVAIFSQYTIIATGAFIGLQVLGIDPKALGVILGGSAIALSFGLRDLANNFACGFLLLIERPLRVGDTVTINNIEGDVVNIGARAVTVRTWDHMDFVVPNAQIFSQSFTNWTAKDHVVRTVAVIKIHRHDDLLAVQKLIYTVLAECRGVLTDPVPEVFLNELSDFLVEFEVRYYINLRIVKSRPKMRSEVLMAIWQAFEKQGIKPPYPLHEILVRPKEEWAIMPRLAE